MRLSVLVPAAAALLLVLAILPTPPAAPGAVPEPARGRMANLGLDHAEQSDPPPELQPAPEPRNEVVVLLQDGAFEPRELSVPAGTVVKFLMRDEGSHTVTGRLAGEVGVRIDAALAAGGEASLPLDKAGLYQLRCRYHSPNYGEGMVAEVRVQP